MKSTLALVGNPNVGKTALFNALTGLSQNTGNYPGVTVDRKYGDIKINGFDTRVVDLPGTYSMAARSPDEIIVADVLMNQQPGEDTIEGIIAVIDASNLERNLYFFSQLLDLNLPIIMALNMIDIADRRGIVIDAEAMSRELGLPVIPICAHKAIGVDRLKIEIQKVFNKERQPTTAHCPFPVEQDQALKILAERLEKERPKLGRAIPAPEVFRILTDQGGHAETRIVHKLGRRFKHELDILRKKACHNGVSLASQEARCRYNWVRDLLKTTVTRPASRIKTRSERLDNILTHRFFGSFIFVGLMLIVFQSIYTWAGPLMNFIDSNISKLGEFVGAFLPQGMLQSLIVDGIFAGVGGVLIFLPQILLLSCFIALLEDCGYMSRAAFLMDKLLGWCGLSGQSFIPMLSSFACAIPGIMSTRTIPHREDRFTTILVAPLMSCSARLPVYVIMIGAFVPDTPLIRGFLDLRGATLFGIYAIGVIIAVTAAWVFKRLIFKGVKPPFILEMPSYKLPQAKTIFKKVYYEGHEFIARAGTLIFAVTVIVWALAYFPHSQSITDQYDVQRQEITQQVSDTTDLETALLKIENRENGAHLENSFMGRIGHTIEPVFIPMGWDWRIATATMASFPAREIIVATLGTLFNLGSHEDEESDSLISTLQAATWPDGRKLFNIPVALSIMVFFALCCQCAATLAVIKRETGQWRWPILSFTYMTILAYVASIITYQSALFLGLGP